MTEEESKSRETLKKILRALRAVLISEMDYQVELQEMKPSRFKLIFYVLLAATTVTWAVGSYTHWGDIRIDIALLLGWTILILTWLTRKGRKRTKEEMKEVKNT